MKEGEQIESMRVYVCVCVYVYISMCVRMYVSVCVCSCVCSLFRWRREKISSSADGPVVSSDAHDLPADLEKAARSRRRHFESAADARIGAREDRIQKSKRRREKTSKVTMPSPCFNTTVAAVAVCKRAAHTHLHTHTRIPSHIDRKRIATETQRRNS